MVETNGWTQEKANEQIKVLAKRAQTDMEFRKLCLCDPVAAVAQIDPTPMPDWFKIRFVENEGATLTVVLPDPTSSGDGELSDAELEQVAGGARGCGSSCLVSCEFTAIV